MRVVWRTPLVGFFKKNYSHQSSSLKLAKMCSCDAEEAVGIDGRALHYVFKIPDRKETIRFYKNVLGMKVLRHEEFAEGCEATCNGPYDNRWSKTMVGYGPEDKNFVFELTYNYPIKHYDKGNEFIGVTLINQDILKRAAQENWPVSNGNVVEAPGGYKFFIVDKPQPANPVEKVTLSCSNLDKTIQYWNSLLGLKVYARELEKQKSVQLGFEQNQTKIEFVEIAEPINRAEAFGRIAFSCPDKQQPKIESKVKKAKGKILVPLTSLDTPGKATVRVVILADPDGHEICFVNDGPFRQLSKYAPEDDCILEVQMKKDETRRAKEEHKKAAGMNEQVESDQKNVDSTPDKKKATAEEGKPA